jgi:hypothetical protein
MKELQKKMYNKKLQSSSDLNGRFSTTISIESGIQCLYTKDKFWIWYELPQKMQKQTAVMIKILTVKE